jgi:hypothetical protein
MKNILTSNECDPERCMTQLNGLNQLWLSRGLTHPKNEREAQSVNTIEIEEIEECVECQAVWRHVVR